MTFSYSRRGLSQREWWLERGLEILPATLSWSLLISLFLLCVFAPVAGVVTIILFDLYWLFRLIYLTIFLVLSYGLLQVERSAKWEERLKDLSHVEEAITRIQKERNKKGKDWKVHLLEQRHLATLKRLKQDSFQVPPLKDIFHLVIIPFFQEELPVLRSTLQALARVDYPLDKIVVILGVEERAGEGAGKVTESLEREYGHLFSHLEACVHPDGIPGEAAVKGANATHAAKWARRFFETRRIPLEDILVSCFDSDTVVSPEYFACLTYNFLTHPKRSRTSFQPIPVYHNNIWQAPPFARVLETGSSFFQLVEATEPEHLVTFSSHSMSFQALVEMDYWPLDLVSDDSAIFWKAFLAFDGDYRVEPLYVTLSMDVALGENFWETCRSIYQQKRRWAWGVENFPILVRGFLAHPKIPLLTKIRHSLRILEMNITWATWTPIMLILSWAPALLPTHEFTTTVAHFNAPRVAGVICNLAVASLAISIILSFTLLPKSSRRIPFFHQLVFLLQWLLVPVIATIFGAIPALDAQTRLALGHYMEFFVTPKGRPKKERPARRRVVPI